jgi:hypothetical protein
MNMGCGFRPLMCRNLVNLFLHCEAREISFGPVDASLKQVTQSGLIVVKEDDWKFMMDDRWT